MNKQLFLSVLTIISAVLSFYFLKLGLTSYLFLIPGLLLLPLVWGLTVLLIEDIRPILAISLFSAGSLLLLFGLKAPYLICATLIPLSLLWGFQKIQKEKKLRLKIAVEEIIPKGLGGLFFALSITLAVAFYFSPLLQKTKQGIEAPFWAEEKMLALAIPGFSSSVTVDQMLNLISKQSKDQTIADPARQKALEELGLGEFKLSGSEKISQRPEILDKLVGQNINRIIEGMAGYLPFILAFFVWQIIIWVNKLLIPLVGFLITAIYSILRLIGFIKIENVSAEKEKICL